MSRIAISPEAQLRLSELREALAPAARRGLMATLGREVERAHRAHFRQLEATSPNRRGWPRQHFWARIRQATAYDDSATTDTSAKVVVSDPALLPHIYGGTIRPKEKKLLAIPNRKEAYGIRPSSKLIPGLFYFQSKKGVKGLARLEQGKFAVYYWLKESVTIPAKPGVLPAPAAVEAALLKAAEAYVARRQSQPAP